MNAIIYALKEEKKLKELILQTQKQKLFIEKSLKYARKLN